MTKQNRKNKSKSILTQALKICLILSASVLLLSAGFYRFNPSKDPITNIPVSAGEAESPTVILDAGHGGVDSGAVSVLGAEEKHINLSIAKKLGSFLEAAGVKVIYTRTEDVMLTSDRGGSRKTKDLLGRVEIAEQNPDALFVSIHMNTLPIEKYAGLQAFYSEENSANKALAQMIQNVTASMLQPDNNRKAKNAEGKVFILDRIDQPAVLLECGFLSNYAEAELLTTDQYQTKLAFVLSRPILDFVLESEKN